MTPLAHAIAVDSCLPLAKRRYGNAAAEVGLFNNLHFFDVSSVYMMANDMSEKVASAVAGQRATMAFLPAPRVMLEWATPWGEYAQREAVILEQLDDTRASVRIVAMAKDGRVVCSPTVLSLPLIGSSEMGELRFRPGFIGTSGQADDANNLGAQIYSLLAIINTPRLINRAQHMPHAGLQRRLAAARGLVGKFPLRAWTELKLEVRPPHDASHKPSQANWMTGEKCLHFCRAHLRIRLGRLEFVSSHWRGDASLGIKQTRYSLVAQRSAA